MRGRNRFVMSKSLLLEAAKGDRPCIFLSHSSEDKPSVKVLAEFLLASGLDIYFDANDVALQSAMSQEDPEKIVAAIQDGLNNSSHALCIISQNTVSSQWVPYEIGYSVSRGHPLALFQLAEVNELPQFYKVAPVISDRIDLGKYIEGIAAKRNLFAESVTKSPSATLPTVSTILPSVRTPKFK